MWVAPAQCTEMRTVKEEVASGICGILPVTIVLSHHYEVEVGNSYP